VAEDATERSGVFHLMPLYSLRHCHGHHPTREGQWPSYFVAIPVSTGHVFEIGKVAESVQVQ
jgi:hypothetical protein